ncbi:C45 family peptidase [Pseudacidovorax intermedius]|uniref:C45 family autoproteolytic acyltransferase/hydolase n=1 Tax=Pseudacidovorax intermedius TaxID=433924 RepID=UPI0026F0707E|nr:C45 family peptidase [Pseudacidovorax intermedius]
MDNLAPFPFVSVSGTAYERGRAYGAAVPDRVARSTQIYGRALDGLGAGEAFRRQLTTEFAARIEAYGSHYLEEMRGIADGAGVSLGDVVMINARTEVVAQARRQAGAGGAAATPPEPEEGCTGAVVLAGRSSNGRLLHGQNWDWRSECIETGIVLRVQREDGPDILTFVEAGGLARSGLNSAGIALTANYLECERDFRTTGVPLSLLRRKILEQQHFAEAMGAVVNTPKSCANNLMMSTAEGFAIDFECAPDEVFSVLPEDDLLVHANHWVSTAARSKLRDTGVANMPDSYYRDWRVKRLLREAGPTLDLADLKQAFFDDFATPFAVCRPPRPSSLAGNLSATVAMIAMEPAGGFMDVLPLPALQRGFTRYSLTEQPRPVAEPA